MRKIVLITLTLFVSGCATVKTTSTVYRVDNFTYQGKNYTYYRLSDQNNLQYDHVVSLVDSKLKQYGLTRNDNNADYIITMTYGMSGPQNRTVARPIYGQTGVSGAYTTSTYNTAGNSLSGTSNTVYTPSYGVVGAVPVTVTSYTSYFRLDMYLADHFQPGNSKPVYTVETQSSNQSGILETVLPTLVVSAFSNFPGNSGDVYSHSYHVNSETGLPDTN